MKPHISVPREQAEEHLTHMGWAVIGRNKTGVFVEKKGRIWELLVDIRSPEITPVRSIESGESPADVPDSEPAPGEGLACFWVNDRTAFALRNEIVGWAIRRGWKLIEDSPTETAIERNSSVATIRIDMDKDELRIREN